MKRVFFFILKLVVVVGIAVWFVDRSGTARIVWGDYVIETSAAFIGLVAVLLGYGFYLLFRFWSLMQHGPSHMRLRRKLKKLQQGQDHLTQGLVAIAGGDAAEAGRRAVHARRLLGTTPSTKLLQAQAAQLAGDHKTAREIFRALAADPESAVLGYRGLIMEARRNGNWAEAEKLVDKLHRLRPETPWLNLVRFELLARRQAWTDAAAALGQAASARLLDTTTVKQHRAAILAASAQHDMRQGRFDTALQAAEQASKQAPDWLPAIISLADAQRLAGHRRAMQRTIERAWAKHPHPQLAAIIKSDTADPVEACRAIEKLSAANEDAPESHLAIAEASIAAGIWGTARRHLMALLSKGAATQTVYRLMARLERRESGDEGATFHWLAKAAEAPADPAWLCRSCGGAHKEWQPVCSHCGSFNMLDWRSPGIGHSTFLKGHTEITSELTTI